MILYMVINCAFSFRSEFHVHILSVLPGRGTYKLNIKLVTNANCLRTHFTYSNSVYLVWFVTSRQHPIGIYPNNLPRAKNVIGICNFYKVTEIRP